MVAGETITECANCGETVTGDTCLFCGQPAWSILPRESFVPGLPLLDVDQGNTPGSVRIPKGWRAVQCSDTRERETGTSGDQRPLRIPAARSAVGSRLTDQLPAAEAAPTARLDTSGGLGPVR